MMDADDGLKCTEGKNRFSFIGKSLTVRVTSLDV